MRHLLLAKTALHGTGLFIFFSQGPKILTITSYSLDFYIEANCWSYQWLVSMGWQYIVFFNVSLIYAECPDNWVSSRTGLEMLHLRRSVLCSCCVGECWGDTGDESPVPGVCVLMHSGEWSVPAVVGRSTLDSEPEGLRRGNLSDPTSMLGLGLGCCWIKRRIKLQEKHAWFEGSWRPSHLVCLRHTLVLTPLSASYFHPPDLLLLTVVTLSAHPLAP